MTTAQTLRKMATVVSMCGLHTGEQFIARDGHILRYDISAIAYLVAEDLDPKDIPTEFFNDEAAAIDLIEASEPAMNAIKALSASLYSEPCETNGVPDYIEHVSNWAATAPIGQTEPPSVPEVIHRILHAANQYTAPATHAA